MRTQHGEAAPALALLTIKLVTARTGLARSTVYQAVRDEKFPAPVRPLGRAPRWRATDVERWLAALEPEPKAAPRGTDTNRVS